MESIPKCRVAVVVILDCVVLTYIAGNIYCYIMLFVDFFNTLYSNLPVVTSTRRCYCTTYVELRGGICIKGNIIQRLKVKIILLDLHARIFHRYCSGSK